MKKKIIVIMTVALIVILGVIFFIIINKNSNKTTNIQKNNLESKKIEQSQKEIEIFKGTDSPIAFMIDNNQNAQPQASINSAYIVYEIIVEGGETRLMALFKNVETDRVGPIRSARHYFLDYAMENDAIYAHLGMSPQAQSDIERFHINNINGQVYDTGKQRTETSLYWREKHKKAPHNAYTSIDSIKKISKEQNYNIISDKKSVLNYVPDEVNLEMEDAIIANVITIPYTESHKVKYEYNVDTKRYVRYSKNKKITDEITKEDITTKNIIITLAKNYDLKDKEAKGRQEVVTVGELDGYYITNGKAIKIKCIKKGRTEQTKYIDLKGNEIEVNDGNTWINICPIDSSVSITQ